MFKRKSNKDPRKENLLLKNGPINLTSHILPTLLKLQTEVTTRVHLRT